MSQSRLAATFVLALGLLLSLPAAAVFAQAPGTREPVAHRQVLSANPFGLMFKWANVDYERKITESSTWGASASTLGLGDEARYLNVQLAYRYYPQGAALSGFYLGGRGGVHRVSRDDESGQFAGLGFEIGYDWLLGPRQNVSIGIGAGATRLFGGRLADASLTVPTVRLLNVGVAF